MVRTPQGWAWIDLHQWAKTIARQIGFDAC
jgi:hypothetical protein